jgi:hypothetical protein
MEHRIMRYVGKFHRIAISAALMIMCCAMLCVRAVSSPTSGSWQSREEIGGKIWSTTRTFRGGERAAVLAIGDHEEPDVRVQIAVFDAKGVLIAEDKGDSELAGDYVGLVWYPPRDGDYRIEVRHSGADVNKIYIAIK